MTLSSFIPVEWFKGGWGKNLASNVIAEDSINKELIRVVLNDADGVYVNAAGGSSSNSLVGVVSTVNSTTTPLGIGATFTGTAEEVKDYSHIEVQVYSSHDSGADGLTLEFSTDGTNWDQVQEHTIVGGDVHITIVPVTARYFRLTLTNGAVAQTTLRLQTIFRPVAVGGHLESVSGDVSDGHVAQVVRSIIAAKNPSGDYVNVEADAGDNLRVSIAPGVEDKPADSAALSNVAGNAANTTLLAANSDRRGATIVNDSAAILYVKFGATASATSFTYKMMPGDTLEFPAPIYQGIVDGIWVSATGAARMTEME